MKLRIFILMMFVCALPLRAQKHFVGYRHSHGDSSQAGFMDYGETLLLHIFHGTVSFHGVPKSFQPVDLRLVPGERKSVVFRSLEDSPEETRFTVWLTGNGGRLYLDADSNRPVVIDNGGWLHGSSYTVSQDYPNSDMRPNQVNVSVRTIPPGEAFDSSCPSPQYQRNPYGNNMVTVIIEGGYVAFFGKRKHYEPVAFDIACGERKEVEFRSVGKHLRKAKFWMSLSEDGNTLRVDDGQRKEIVLINRDWEHGQVYHPKERDDHGSRMEALDVTICVRNKNTQSYRSMPQYQSGVQPQCSSFPMNPVTVIIEDGYVAFFGKRKHYRPVAFDINPGESKLVEFVSTDKHPRKMSYVVSLSEDGNTLKLDADQRKAIVLINRDWEHGQVYHPKERDDHGSRMEALNIKVTVRQKGRKNY